MKALIASLLLSGSGDYGFCEGSKCYTMLSDGGVRDPIRDSYADAGLSEWERIWYVKSPYLIQLPRPEFWEAEYYCANNATPQVTVRGKVAHIVCDMRDGGR